MEAARAEHIRGFRGTDSQALWECSTTAVAQLLLFAGHPVLPRGLFIGLAALVFVRWFMLFHDAGHGSLAASDGLNRALHFGTGVLCWTPRDWRRKHRLHHSTAGHLDNELGFNFNEITFFTVETWARWPRLARWGYLFGRYSQLMWLLLPFWAWGFTFRAPLVHQPHVVVRERVLNTAGLLLELWAVHRCCGRACTWDFCRAAYCGMVLGIVLFHAQHTFEESYVVRRGGGGGAKREPAEKEEGEGGEGGERWSFSRAAFEGSSCQRVPWCLRWFLMGIEYHMIHHSDPKVGTVRHALSLPSCFH
jgi:omega-6 fatty acid desaturase (delta-12 desaturase)